MIRVGDVVEPVQRPEGYDRWRVIAVDGVIVTLQSNFPVKIRRHVKDVRRVKE